MKKYRIDFSTISAIIWDMDGVLSDTQKFHAESESALLSEHDIKISKEEITSVYAGMADELMFQEIFLKHNKSIPDMKKLLERKWKLMERISKNNVTFIPHAKNLVQTCKDAGFLMAIASSSPQSFIDHITNSLTISSYFPVCISAQSVERGKPSPDVFLYAAKKLGVLPEQCLVIEDGVSGMIGAKNAGMHCIGLVDNQEKQVPADVTVTSLHEIIDMISL